MSVKMVTLLERLVELQEEANEQQREITQLLGELLNATDKPVVVSNLSTPFENTSVKNILNEGAVKTPAPPPDGALLYKAIHGTSEITLMTPNTHYQIDHFWPKGKANPGWVRVSIKHPSKESLDKRLARGCLCGKPIILKEQLNGESFHTCEALTQKGGCPYRPAAYFDKLTFLCNLPPSKT